MAGQEEVSVVEGWTEEIPFTLKEDGVASPYDSSTTVAVVLYDKAGNLIAHTGSITTFPDSGFAGIVPAAGELLESKSPYSLRFKLTDAITAREKFYPSGVPILLRVQKP